MTTADPLFPERVPTLAIEIGGTKLQVGVAMQPGEPWLAIERALVDPEAGASGIRDTLERLARPLIDQYRPSHVGIGFGGPVDPRRGRTVTSHQIDGWDDFDLRGWCHDRLGLPCAMANDCDAAALGEARHGAGQGALRVFYVTVGTGVGGGYVCKGELDGSTRPAIAEIGHLRYGLEAIGIEETVESRASGWGIARHVTDRLAAHRERCDGCDSCRPVVGCRGIAGLETRQLAELAAAGNDIVLPIFQQATRTLGWAIAQMLTLLAVEVVVIGGGVPRCGEELFWRPLRAAIDQYVFPPLRNTYHVVPAALGDTVVLVGALELPVPPRVVK